MIRRLLLCTALLTAVSIEAATTYTFTGNNYNSTRNYSSCTTGADTCASFTTSMAVSGSFTVPSLIAPGQNNKDISNELTSWSFSDGLSTISSTDPNARVYVFAVSTNAGGLILSTNILVELWQSGSSPHQAYTDRFAWMRISATSEEAVYNDLCVNVGTAPNLLAQPDTCLNDNGISGSYSSQASGSGAWSGGGLATVTPTLGQWGMICLTLLLLLFALSRLRQVREPSGVA